MFLLSSFIQRTIFPTFSNSLTISHSFFLSFFLSFSFFFSFFLSLFLSLSLFLLHYLNVITKLFFHTIQGGTTLFGSISCSKEFLTKPMGS